MRLKKRLSLVVALLLTFLMVTPAFAMGVSDLSSIEMNSIEFDADQIDELKAQLISELKTIDQDTDATPANEAEVITGTKEAISLEPLPQDKVASSSDIDFANIKPFDSVSQSAAIRSFAAGETTVQPTSGTLSISPNTVYSHGLGYNGDYYFYLTQMTSNVDVTAFLTSNSMEYYIGVLILDAQQNIISEEYSSIPHSYYSGQRIRVTASAGQYVAMFVQQYGSFVPGNSYTFGLMTTSPSNRDPYEHNDNPQKAAYTGNITTNLAIYSGASIDNPYDVDWYAFSFDGQPGYNPSVQFWGQGINDSDVVALIYSVVNGNLVYRFTYRGQYDSYLKIPDTTSGTYYIAVLSDTARTGSYYLAQKKMYMQSEVQLKFRIEESYGDEGFKNYGYGSRKTARYQVYGKISIKDSYGNPIIGSINVGLWGDTMELLAFGKVYTDSTGIGHFSFSISDKLVAPYRSFDGTYEHYFDTAKLVILDSDYTVYAEENWYYTSGFTYWDNPIWP